MFASRYPLDATSRYVERKRRTNSVSLFLFFVQHVHLTDQSKMLSGFLFSRYLSLALVSLLLYLYAVIPPSPFLRSIRDLSSIQTPSYGPLPVTPSAFTLPSTSFRYSPPSSCQSQSQSSPTQFFFFKKSRSRNQKPDFIKRSVDFPISSNYVCKPFQITRFDCPSLLRSFARWHTRLYFPFSTLTVVLVLYTKEIM